MNTLLWSLGIMIPIVAATIGAAHFRTGKLKEELDELKISVIDKCNQFVTWEIYRKSEQRNNELLQKIYNELIELKTKFSIKINGGN